VPGFAARLLRGRARPRIDGPTLMYDGAIAFRPRHLDGEAWSARKISAFDPTPGRNSRGCAMIADRGGG